MRKTISLIVSLIFITTLFAQETGLRTYALHFRDKGLNKNAVLNPSKYLSDKTIERRLKQNIAFDEYDIPVNDLYLKEVLKTGARILTSSRWLNTVVIEVNMLKINELSALQFVSKIQPLDHLDKPLSYRESSKLFFEAETFSPAKAERNKQKTSDLYDYGSAFNQINQLKGQYLHNLGYSGKGIAIAVIDAGFNSVDKMPCFDSLRKNSQIKGTRDFAQPGNDVYATSMDSHGTSVLSCMAAYINGQMVGTAPKADYWLLRSEVGATESIIEEYYWVSAAEYADSVGAQMINSSLGYTTFDDPSTNHTYADMDGNTTVVTKGADMAAAKGILVVNSAGNSGNGAWKYIGAPADGDSVFTIGANTAAGLRSVFSSVGPTSDGQTKPTVSAQGSATAVFSPTGLGFSSGTSFSSPIICGISACLWQAIPGLNNMQIINLIKANSSQAGKPDSLLGWGIPDYQMAFNTLSNRNQSVAKALTIYPNPVTDKLTLGFPVYIQGKISIEIVNLQGLIIYKDQRNDGSIRSFQINDIGFLPSGIYLIKVSDRSSSFSGKIIKM